MPQVRVRTAPASAEPRSHARQLNQIREAALTGDRSPATPRPVIGASWRRVRWSGLDPAGAPEIALLGFGELERSRADSGLAPLLPLLRERLLPSVQAAGEIMVVVDRVGRVLWREGGRDARRRADALGFVEGSAWGELSVGTNAIGTSLVVGAPVQVHAAEHYADSHQPWTCAAAPLHDPVTGALLGAVDVSGPASTVHPSTLALVDAVARLAELEVRAVYEHRVQGLRSLAAPLLAGLPGRALVVTTEGWIAAATGMPVPDRILLPDTRPDGSTWLPSLGRCRAEPLPGGWLLRLDEKDDGAAGAGTAAELLLDVADSRPVAAVTGASGTWRHPLTLRHAELLLVLAHHPQGCTAAELAGHVFDDRTRTVTVRAELSRLRRTFGPLLQNQPYRLADGLRTRVLLPDDPRLLLPASTAPLVVAMRQRPIKR